MPEMMAFTSATPRNSRYESVSPTGTRPAWTSAESRLEFIRANGRRLGKVVAQAMEKVEGGFDQDELYRANVAVREAVNVMSPIEFGEMPWIEISDDCVVSMHWEQRDEGVLVTFAGDGVIAFAIKTGAATSYADGFTERNASEGLPDDVRSAISRLSLVRANLTAA
jgi:hypothetical protein